VQELARVTWEVGNNSIVLYIFEDVWIDAGASALDAISTRRPLFLAL
jgi:hypothetical protein